MALVIINTNKDKDNNTKENKKVYFKAYKKTELSFTVNR